MAVAFALLDRLGVQALGIGWFAAALTEAAIFSATVGRRLGVDFTKPCGAPVVAAALGALLGYLVASRIGHGYISGALSAITATGVYLTALMAASSAHRHLAAQLWAARGSRLSGRKRSTASLS